MFFKYLGYIAFQNVTEVILSYTCSMAKSHGSCIQSFLQLSNRHHTFSSVFYANLDCCVLVNEWILRFIKTTKFVL